MNPFVAGPRRELAWGHSPGTGLSRNLGRKPSRALPIWAITVLGNLGGSK